MSQRPEPSTSDGLADLVRRELAPALRPAAVWVVLQVVGLIVGLALIGRHGGGVSQPLDDDVHRWFLDHRSGLIGISKVIAKVGDAPMLGVLVVVATVILLLLWRQRRALTLFVAYLGGEATVYVVRLVISRPRPLSANFPGPGAIPGVHETSFSFPSGHATAVSAVFFAIAALVAHRHRMQWPWVVAFLGSVVVAGSRLVLGVHWFTDVTIGLVLGSIWGIVAGTWFARIDDPVRPAREVAQA